MISLFRKFTWWVQRRRKEEELREELEFHLANEAVPMKRHVRVTFHFRKAPGWPAPLIGCRDAPSITFRRPALRKRYVSRCPFIPP